MRVTLALGPFLPVPPVAGGAVERLMWNLADAFRARGCHMTVIARQWPGQLNREEAAGINIIRIPSFGRPESKLLGYLYDLIYSLRLAAAAPEGDVIITNSFFLPLTLNPSRVGIIYVHIARMPRNQLRLYRRAGRFHAVSGDVGRAIEAQAPELLQKILVVPNALPPPFSGVVALDLKARAQIVLYAGRIAREKGLELLIKGFGRAGLTGWRLVLMGPVDSAGGGDGETYRSELVKLAAALELDCEFRAPTYDIEALKATYAEAPIFVYPSVAEGETFGMAPLEAMACGCAVVVSDLACFREFAQPGCNCLSFDHRGEDPAGDLAAALMRLARDGYGAQAIATAGRAEAERFGINAVANALLADFEQQLAARREERL